MTQRNAALGSLSYWLPAETPKEKAKLAGPGLLLCDSQPERVSEEHFYILPMRCMCKLSFEDCSTWLTSRTGCLQTPEEKAKLAGPGLLLCDSQPEGVSEEHFYLVASDSGLQIVDGQHAKQSGNASAQVLFLCRPPAPVGGSVASQTSELLQV